MNRTVRILFILILCLLVVTAQADTYYVKPDAPLSLRDESTNEVLTTIPAGTALTPVGEKCTDICAYVTYGGYSGLVLWNYLTRTAPDQAAVSQTAIPPQPSSGISQAAAGTAPSAEGPMTLQTVNAVIQRANSKNKAEGAEMTEAVVTAADNLIITAKIPKGKKIDYWVINGVRYDFLRTVSSLRLTNFDQSWIFEVVFKKADSTTLHSPEEIQAARTGSPLLCKVISGELCHIKSGTKGGGGWITEFDFTNDYSNRATGVMEQGGQLTAKIRAVIPKNKKIVGWKYNETEVYNMGTTVSQFVVNSLDTSMTYEPIFGKAAAKPTDPPTTETKYVTVKCIKCKISGGPYSGQTSAKVPVGTKITVTASGNSSIVDWIINGSISYNGEKSITRTIKVNTTIEACPQIN